MSNLTFAGNLTGDPELRFTSSGAAVANFTIASTPRHFDKTANEWKDGEAIFMRCSAWRELAENVAETLHRGSAVIATGKLKSRSWDDKDGQKRTVIEMDVDDIGPSLRRATANVTKTQRNGQGFDAQVNPGGGWGQPSVGQNANGWAPDEPPFSFPPVVISGEGRTW